MANEELIRFQRVDSNIAVVTLNRPEKRNAINPEMMMAMHEVVQNIEKDTSIWITILASSHPAVFCAGSDLSTTDNMHPQTGFAGFCFHPRKKPWIAAVEGMALAGGFEIALACEMRICGESSAFGLPEVKRGVVAAAGGLWRLPRSVAPAVAMDLVLSAERMTGKRAYELGIVSRIVPDGQVMNEALKLARSIVANAPVAVRESVALLNKAQYEDDKTLIELSNQVAERIKNSKDFEEGVKAFLGKREPVWRGE
jgi:enoyl-CoA hydratase/carnithine racemase